MIIGLTGGIGSGKSEVSRRFQQLGITVVDADEVARDVVKLNSPALQAIAEHFGRDILNPDSSLNRAALRNIVFQNTQEKIWLENLLHPIIRELTIQQLQNSSSIYTILASPLLLETTQRELVDRVLVIDANENIQLTRASNRDNNNLEQIKAIMKTQLTRTERCAKANDIIQNNGDLSELDQQVLQLHKTYLTLVEDND